MQNHFELFQNTFNEHKIELYNQYLDQKLQDFLFFYITNDNHNEQIINQKENVSKVIITAKNDQNIFIIFEKTILVISEKDFRLLSIFLNKSKAEKATIITLTNDLDDIFHEYKQKDEDSYFQNQLIDHIKTFSKRFESKNQFSNEMQKIWKKVTFCLCAYFLQKSFNKFKIDRIDKFNQVNHSQIKEIELNEDQVCRLNYLDSGSQTQVYLFYHIEREEFFVVKYFAKSDLVKCRREDDNYKELQFPLLPSYYGMKKDKNNYCLMMEFIYGRKLSYIKLLHFDINKKLEIIFEIMIIFEYLHHNKLIYRDLKPNNIILDHNKTVVLIDFDRMLKKSSIDPNNETTKNFDHYYLAPEIGEINDISYEADIYSLGLIIYFIIFEKDPVYQTNDENSLKNLFSEFPEDYTNIKYICEKCTKHNPKSRPTISQLIIYFYNTFYMQISQNLIPNESQKTTKKLTIKYIKDKDIINNGLEKTYFIDKLLSFLQKYHLYDPIVQYLLGRKYLEGIDLSQDINKGIRFLKESADQDNSCALQHLGFIYTKDTYVKKDIQKSFYYLKLASDLNNQVAQNDLGVYYLDGKIITQDIEKAIYYLTLAANQNYPSAQFSLGTLYFNGPIEYRDINKAINYFKLSADSNNYEAQYFLGIIYYDGRGVKSNFDLAYHYLSLAAEQNEAIAQNYMGLIYYDEKFISCDYKKAIKYFELAANQNHCESQYLLGSIYCDEYEDFEKGIKYYLLAANQNNPKAQFWIGKFYIDGIHVPRDINKAINYFTLSANSNFKEAQHYLGLIFYELKYGMRNINKAIHYFTLAAKQNYHWSQYKLGIILSDGKTVDRDMQKAINYLTLAANQNNYNAMQHLALIYLLGNYVKQDVNKALYYLNISAKYDSGSQHILGVIYYQGKFVQRDVNKALYCFNLSAKHNNLHSLFCIGYIYYEGIYVPRDVNLAIKCFSQSKSSKSYYYLGYIYYEGKYVPQDINKAIYFLTLSSEQNNSDAQYLLGQIYYRRDDIAKAFNYFSLSANQNNPKSQYYLGLIYLNGRHKSQNINKAIYYLQLSANRNIKASQYVLGNIFYGEYNRKTFLSSISKSIYYLSMAAKTFCENSNFLLGVIYFEGNAIEQDIEKAIHYYKEDSSMNNQYAKNNLALIYKNGYGVEKNIAYAIDLLKEAIKQKNDKLAMYNLAKIYFYGEDVKQNIDESISLLCNSAKKGFQPSKELLCLVLLAKYKSDKVINLIEKNGENSNENEELVSQIDKMIAQNNLKNNDSYNFIYEQCKTIDYAYNFFFKPYLSSIAFEKNKKENKLRKDQENMMKNITDLFYEGFGIRI